MTREQFLWAMTAEAAAVAHDIILTEKETDWLYSTMLVLDMTPGEAIELLKEKGKGEE